MSAARPKPARQRGAALVVGLILLMVLTVLAISTVRTASLELTMTGNAQFRQRAFQLAESGIADTLGAINRGTRSLPADCPAEPGPAVRIEQLAGSYQTRVCFLGSTPPLASGSSLGSGKLREDHYQVISTGGTDQRGARAQHVQGISRLAPEGL